MLSRACLSREYFYVTNDSRQMCRLVERLHASTRKEEGPALHRPSSSNPRVAGSTPARRTSKTAPVNPVNGAEARARASVSVSREAPVALTAGASAHRIASDDAAR